MNKVPAIIITALLILGSTHLFAEDIILRLKPDANSPAITRIIATEKVLLDAAPADENNDWRKLDLKVPFDGYVPAATLTKNFAIIDNTPVHALPDAKTDIVTRVNDGDLYEVKRVSDEWATIRFNKQLTTYFRAGALPSAAPKPSQTPISDTIPEPVPEAPVLDLTISAPTHTPEPKAAEFDPKLGVGKTSPEDLPPENVLWKSASRSSPPIREPQPQATQPQQAPPALPNGIMVEPSQTQAREANTNAPPGADKPHRILTGILVREIEADGPAYPVRLQSPEGRLIAYVDFSGYFIDDLSPYIDERVILRGQIIPLKTGSRNLVIFVHDILLAD